MVDLSMKKLTLLWSIKRMASESLLSSNLDVLVQEHQQRGTRFVPTVTESRASGGQ